MMLAHVEYPPTPFAAAARQAATDDQLVELWLQVARRTPSAPIAPTVSDSWRSSPSH
jgi:hypothetical protein